MSKKQSTAAKQANAQRAAERAAAIRAEQERKERRKRTFIITGAVVAVLALIVLVVVLVQAGVDVPDGHQRAAAADGVRLERVDLAHVPLQRLERLIAVGGRRVRQVARLGGVHGHAAARRGISTRAPGGTRRPPPPSEPGAARSDRERTVRSRRPA